MPAVARLMPLAVALCACVLGCAQVLGVDKYSNAESVSLTAAPFDQKLPYLTGEECQHCIAVNCSNESDACNADPVCSSWLSTMQDVGFGPIADYDRTFLAPPGGTERELDAGPQPSATWNALNECLKKRNGYRDAGCLDRCEIGRNFSCVLEQFVWPATKQGTKDISLRLVADDSGNGWPDWDVRFCGTPTCDPVVAGQTDTNGLLKLSVQVDDNPSSRYLLASKAGAYPFTYLMPAGPIRSGFTIEERVSSKDAVDQQLTDLGISWDPSLAAAWVFPKDCLGNPARQVTIDVWSAHGGQGWTLCSELDCPRIYPGVNGEAEVGQPDLSLGPRALVTGLQARDTWLIVRDAKSQAAVGMQKFGARRGSVHSLIIYPASGPELAQLDDLKHHALQ